MTTTNLFIIIMISCLTLLILFLLVYPLSKISAAESRKEEIKKSLNQILSEENLDPELKEFIITLYILKTQYNILVSENKFEKAEDIAVKYNIMLQSNKKKAEEIKKLNLNFDYLPEFSNN